MFGKLIWHHEDDKRYIELVNQINEIIFKIRDTSHLKNWVKSLHLIIKGFGFYMDSCFHRNDRRGRDDMNSRIKNSMNYHLRSYNVLVKLGKLGTHVYAH